MNILSLTSDEVLNLYMKPKQSVDFHMTFQVWMADVLLRYTDLGMADVLVKQN